MNVPLSLSYQLSHGFLQCIQDSELRQRLQDSERKLGLSMPLNEAKERAAQLESEVTSLDRYGLK